VLDEVLDRPHILLHVEVRGTRYGGLAMTYGNSSESTRSSLAAPEANSAMVSS